MLVLGIDTGSQGAYVALDQSGGIVFKGVFVGGDEGIDFNRYIEDLRFFKGKSVIAYVEQVHAIYGSQASSTFTFGRNYQLALCGLMASGIDYHLVTPKEWQKVMFFGEEKIYQNGEKGKLATKEMAKIAAQNLFRGESFMLKRMRVPNEGIIDAALIAKYGLLAEQNKPI